MLFSKIYPVDNLNVQAKLHGSNVSVTVKDGSYIHTQFTIGIPKTGLRAIWSFVHDTLSSATSNSADAWSDRDLNNITAAVVKAVNEIVR
jgi:hypothetical protein